MSYTYLLEQGEESLAECFSDIPLSVLSRLIKPAGSDYCNGSGTESFQSSRSGTMSEPLTENPGEGLSMSCAADFHARTSAPQGGGRVLMGSGQDFGWNTKESLAKYDHAACSWKTHQYSLLGGLTEFSETWPRWGIMLDGELFPQPTPFGLMELRASITSVSGFGLPERVPTPNATDNRPRATEFSTERRRQIGKQISLEAYVKFPVRRVPTPTVQDAKNNGAPSQMERNTKPLNAEVGGPLNPTWVEWLMGWPIGWTDLAPLETDRFRLWCASHGIPFTPESESKEPA